MYENGKHPNLACFTSWVVGENVVKECTGNPSIVSVVCLLKCIKSEKGLGLLKLSDGHTYIFDMLDI